MRPAARQRARKRETLTRRSAALAYQEFLEARGLAQAAAHVARYLARSQVGAVQELPGPVGERNVYVLKPRGRVVALADSEPALLLQLGAILATGNRAILEASNPAARTLAALPAEIAARIDTVTQLAERRRILPPCCLPAITRRCAR